MSVRDETEIDEPQLEWPQRIRDALDRDRFVLHAQPIVELSTGETSRHELFLRMVDADKLIPAASFMAAAEDQGSIREIDHWVVGRAIDAARDGLGVHVNLSVRSADAVLLDLIRDRLEESGVDPDRIVFELSAAQILEDRGASREFLLAAAELGCGLALDRFVIGGEDEPLLESQPIGFLKVGPPFMHELARNPARRRVVEAVVALGGRYGQRTIAQGVEDVAILQTVRELGVDQAQGYALGSPAPLENVIRATT